MRKKSGARARSHAGAGARKIRARQTEMAFPAWGGARKGAGRKPKGERAMLPHRTRPDHKPRYPVLVTARLRPGLPSLRRPSEAARILAALATANEAARQRMGEDGSPPALFQVVHHSIQSNHLHLIVEAADRVTLTRGVQGLLVRIARALNRLWRRRGAVFGDRFHERELINPRQVRNALVYVLQNLRKHGIQVLGPDPFSSGPEFDGWGSGWARRPQGARRPEPMRDPRQSGSPAGSRLGGDPLDAFLRLRRAMRTAMPEAQTWMLRAGWMRHGPIDPSESPVRM